MAISQRKKGRPDEFEMSDSGRPSTRQILFHADASSSQHARPSRGGRKGPRPRKDKKAAISQVAATATQAPTPVIGGSLLVGSDQIAEGGE